MLTKGVDGGFSCFSLSEPEKPPATASTPKKAKMNEESVTQPEESEEEEEGKPSQQMTDVLRVRTDDYDDLICTYGREMAGGLRVEVEVGNIHSSDKRPNSRRLTFGAATLFFRHPKEERLFCK